ncbi:unnamed protein product (macronuclear) [Paramecium tetraurelia]|uniref:Uncharacterized protein n=1 Tax=Paramecium tetraurelia TaxID=5888 RepID=A0DE04_PARTE|nr:uncharacterized protein GSPATT00016113001 [Paramecium tetraurelia]CAK81271.1 unnamed protein product [Paramecium tetraurelia]|eukprot:XP_001448668.1 hypothetical protein (macronuclear) [Paramecium tetraurelia strain d4-2]
MQQIYQQPQLISVAPYLASYCVGYHKEYPISLHQQVFEPDFTMKPNYKAIKTFDPQQLVRYLQNHFPLIRRNIFQFEDQMRKLNQIFGQIVINGYHIDDFLKQFYFVLDKRLQRLFDDLDQHLIKLKVKQAQELIPGDYRIGDTRKHIRQKLIDMSNDFVTKFASRTNPQAYDREVIKIIDQILRIYELQKYDHGWHFIINITKFNLEDVLERACNNEPTQFQKIDELIESMFIISMKQVKDATEHENTSPLFVFNKDAVLSRFHSIINDRSDPQISINDLYYISKTVCMRDRRIIYNEFYDQINKELKEIAPEYFQFATTEKSEYQKKREELHKKLIKTQSDWESLKEDEIYYLILEDRINEEVLRKVPLTSERQLQQLQNLSAFANKSSKLQSDAVTLLKEILDHKDESKVYIETKLQEALDKAKQYYTKMTPGRTPSSNQIKQYVDSLYSELTNLLNSDISKFQGQMSQTDKSVEQQLAKNKQNPYLQQVQKELQKQQVRDHIQKEHENEMKSRYELVDFVIRSQYQQDLSKENASTKPTQPLNKIVIMEGSSIANEHYYGRQIENNQKPEQEGKYEQWINKNKSENSSSLSKNVDVASISKQHVLKNVGQPSDSEQFRKEYLEKNNQQTTKPDPKLIIQQEPPIKPDPLIDTQIQKQTKNPDPPIDPQQKAPSTEVDPPQKEPSTKTYPQQQQLSTNIYPFKDIHIKQPEASNPIELNQKNIIELNQSFQSQIQSGSESILEKDSENLNEIRQSENEVWEIDFILITPEILPSINKYTKGTKYGKKILITMKEFNSIEYVIQLFEDFNLQDKAYFLDFDVALELLAIFDKLISQEEVEDDVERLDSYIKMTYQKSTGRKNFGEQKNFFPFQDNRFLFYLVEKDPDSNQLIFYFDEQPNEDEMGEEFDQFLQMFQQIFQCEEFEISQVILPPQSKIKLDSFGADGNYIKYMMTVFTIIYEQQNIQRDIIINDDTIERAFWALNQYMELYTALQENEEDVRNTFIEMIEQAQKNNNTVIIKAIEEYYSKEGLENSSLQIQEIYDDFLQNKVIKQAFFSIDIVIQEQQQKYSLYVHLQKVAKTNFLKIFTLESYGEFNELMFNMLLINDGLFTYEIYQDFPRHKIFQEYSEVTLGAFYHLVIKKNLTPEEAMANLVFSVVPYSLILKKQE